jgi:hypothetical protein
MRKGTRPRGRKHRNRSRMNSPRNQSTRMRGSDQGATGGWRTRSAHTGYREPEAAQAEAV